MPPNRFGNSECYQIVVGFGDLLQSIEIVLIAVRPVIQVRDRARYLRMLVPPEGDDVTPSALSAHSQVRASEVSRRVHEIQSGKEQGY